MAQIVRLAQEVEAAGATIINTGIGWHEARIPTIATMVRLHPSCSLLCQRVTHTHPDTPPPHAHTHERTRRRVAGAMHGELSDAILTPLSHTPVSAWGSGTTGRVHVRHSEDARPGEDSPRRYKPHQHARCRRAVCVCVRVCVCAPNSPVWMRERKCPSKNALCTRVISTLVVIVNT